MSPSPIPKISCVQGRFLRLTLSDLFRSPLECCCSLLMCSRAFCDPPKTSSRFTHTPPSRLQHSVIRQALTERQAKRKVLALIRLTSTHFMHTFFPPSALLNSEYLINFSGTQKQKKKNRVNSKKPKPILGEKSQYFIVWVCSMRHF